MKIHCHIVILSLQAYLPSLTVFENTSIYGYRHMRLCPRDITPQSFAGVVPVRHYPNSWDCGIFHIPPASNVVRNRKIPSDPRGGAQAPPRTARRLPRQSGSHCSERLVREPAAFYVRSRDHLDVVADDPDCYLPALPGAPATSEVVPIQGLVSYRYMDQGGKLGTWHDGI